MKTRKAVLAKILAAVLAVTVAVPGALPVNAAKVVTTTETENAETQDIWTQALEEGNVGGTQMWNFQSGSGNRNDNDDFSSASGPAVSYASNWNVTYSEENPTTISLDLYPNGTVEHMRFGILVKYIDPTHWAYINYDAQKSGNHWMLQNDGATYPDIDGLAGVTLSDNAYTNVKIRYLSAGQIEVTVTPDGGEPVIATLDNAILGELETYAVDNSMPIHFGFKGGTWSTQYTNINFKNVKKGTGETLADVDFDSCGWTWVKPDVAGQVMTGTDYVGGTNYGVLDAKEGAAVSAVSELTDFANGTVSAVIRQPGSVNFAVDAKYSAEGEKVQIGYNGSKWYQTVGTAVTNLDNVTFVPESGKDYTVSLEIVNDSLSASITPAEEGAEAVQLVSGVDVSGVAAGSIAFEAGNGTELWVRDVDYTKVVKADPTELQEAYDTVKAEKGETNTDNKYYSDTWTAYEEALTAVKDFLEDEAAEKTPNEVNTLKNTLTAKANALRLVDKTDLENKYNELKEKE